MVHTHFKVEIWDLSHLPIKGLRFSTEGTLMLQCPLITGLEYVFQSVC